MKKFLIYVLCLLSGLVCMADSDTRVNILSYKALVKDIGTAKEDWQPAFQKAIETAFAGNGILYVPAGTYPVWKTITIWKQRNKMFDGTALTLVGDGRFASTIRQMDPKQNCVDWTGKTYKGSISAGTIEKICLAGGKTTLNIKWHNQFTMRSCYIVGGQENGIYAEGWSNRFIDILVRHCPKNGFVGRNHFNDVTIRDGYFSRCGIGINMPGGARGVRISGIGFEHCSTTAIYMQLTMAVVIDNCYFEGDGHSNDRSNFGSSIKLADRNRTYKISGCIFRGTDARSGQIIVATNNGNGRISDNFFQIHRGEAALYFVEPQAKWKAFKGKITICDNTVEWTTKMQKKMKQQEPVMYREEAAGMIDGLTKNGCKIDSGVIVTGRGSNFSNKHDSAQFE